MKTLYVGGKHFFNRFSNLEAAVERAQDDDVIELHKDARDVALCINKNITINGNGHLITPQDGKAALDCMSFVTLNNIRFETKPRTNAIILRNGGHLSDITTHIIGPARAIYPTIVNRGGLLNIVHSKVMYLETYKDKDKFTGTIMADCTVSDYYGGFAYLDNDGHGFSKFRGRTLIGDSIITCAVFEDECTLTGVTLKNFNRSTGMLRLESCILDASRGEIPNREHEPLDGPLRDLNPNATPYALHIAGGKTTVDDYFSDMGRDCIGFYMTKGSLDIRSVKSHNDRIRHLIKGGSVSFNGVVDDGFYEIRKAHCSVVGSKVNTSKEMKSAMEELNAMVGLDSVKQGLRTIMNTISMNVKHPEKDFGFSHHMIFAGDPGTGKTTVAKIAARALFEIGAIPEDKCMEVPASQLVKGYVGQTGEHVEAIMKKALGGVLFIDEAYELMVKDGQNTFNNDVLQVLLRYMEDHRRELVVIAAGYEKEMKEFLASNVGLTRRFQWVSFENYTPQQMTEIFMSMARQCKEDFNFAEPVPMLSRAFSKLTEFYLTHPDAKGRVTNGGNGGLVRNLFQQVVFTRNNRVAEHSGSTLSITEEDIQSGFNSEMKKAICVAQF